MIFQSLVKQEVFKVSSQPDEKRHCVWHLLDMKSLRNKDEYSKYGGEAPRVKDLIIVVVVFIILTILGYIAWDLFKI
jgi:hypothetical protein